MVRTRIVDRSHVWAAFPAEWIKDGRLSTFLGGRRAGVSLAALKMFITLNLRVDEDGAVNITTQSLIDLARVSSIGIVQATRRLISLDMLDVTRQPSKGNKYWIKANSEWCRFPYASEPMLHRLIEGAESRNLALECLKIYLIICAHAAPRSDFEMTSTSLSVMGGIPSFRIPPAIDWLVRHNLISEPRSLAPRSEYGLGFTFPLSLPARSIEIF